MVYQDIDVVFGGGGQYLFPKGVPTPFMDPNGGIIFGARQDSHDSKYMLTEVLAFDEAVGKALAFAKNDGNTLLIAFADHIPEGWYWATITRNIIHIQ